MPAKVFAAQMREVSASAFISVFKLCLVCQGSEVSNPLPPELSNPAS